MRPHKWFVFTLVALSLVAAVAWLLSTITDDAGPFAGERTTAVGDRGDRNADDQPVGTADAVRTPVAGAEGSVERAAIRVRGRLVDAYGEPIEDGLIGDVNSSRPDRVAQDGRFETTAMVDARAVTLLVLATGHSPTVSRHEVDAGDRAVDAGDIQVLYGGRLRGQTTDVAGDPLPGATVTLQLLSSDMWSTTRDFAELLEPAVTDADGAFAFAHLVPGSYRVAASAPGMQAGRSSPQAVPEGGRVTVEPIALAVGYDLAGVVIDPDELPVAGAVVRIRSVGGPARFDGQAETAADGRFQVGSLPLGALRVDVTRAGFLSFRRSDVDASRGEELVVRLEAGLRIAGSVVDARTGGPVARFATSIRCVGRLDASSNGTVEQQLERRIDELRASASEVGDAEQRATQLEIATQLESRLREQRQQVRSRPASVPADLGSVTEHPDGRFEFDGLEEGVYVVGIASPDHQFAQAEPVELRRGTSGPEVRVELTAGQSVSGVVVSKHDGMPVAGATVELVRISQPSPQTGEGTRSLYPWVFARSGPTGVTLMSTRTRADGTFEFLPTAPVRCYVSVRHARFADHDTDEVYLSGGSQRVRIEVGARASLNGRVVGVAPGQQGRVEVLVLGGHGTMRTVNAGVGGAYRFDDLQPGSYIVRAFPSDADQYVNRLFGSIFPLHAGAVDPESIPECDVTLAEGETRGFDVAVDRPATGTVQGTVSINGQPGSGGRAILRPVPGEAPGSGGLSLRSDCDELGRFTIADVPTGNYTLVLYGATRQELHTEPVTVEPDRSTIVHGDLAAGGLRGRVASIDSAPAGDLRGYVWVLPGAAVAPDDLYEYRRDHRTHRIPVRGGSFADDALTPGPVVLVVDIRGRERVVIPTVIPAGGTVDVDSTVGGRSR